MTPEADLLETLPTLTSDLPGIGGRLRASPEDFRVVELPAYEPSGEGEHVWVRFEKRDMTTGYAIDQMCRALGCDARQAGYAGMKDRHAVTEQCVTLPRVDPAQVEALNLDGIRVLAVSRHRNKIRTGHLHGNRFTIRATALDCDDETARQRCEAIAERLRASGSPNFFGEQRFGRDGSNAAFGLAWLRGERPAPREPFLRKLWASAAQSELFNRYLVDRIARGDFARYVPGELAMRHPVGGAWTIDPSEAQALYDAHGASAAGPIFGTAMREASGDALAIEGAVMARYGLTTASFARAKDLAEGTRRAVRVIVSDLQVRVEDRAATFTFTLPAGAYATVLLHEFIKSMDDSLKPAVAGGIQASDRPSTG